KEIWINIADLLNQMSNEEESDTDGALPEDIELIGFVPLETTLKSDKLLPEYEFVPKRIKILRQLANDFCSDDRIDLYVTDGVYSSDQANQPIQEPKLEGNKFEFEGIQEDFDHELDVSDIEDEEFEMD